VPAGEQQAAGTRKSASCAVGMSLLIDTPLDLLGDVA
jgi:hypothetical protein